MKQIPLQFYQMCVCVRVCACIYMYPTKHQPSSQRKKKRKKREKKGRKKKERKHGEEKKIPLKYVNSYIMLVISHFPFPIPIPIPKKKKTLYYSCHSSPPNPSPSAHPHLTTRFPNLINALLSLLPPSTTAQNPSCQGLPPPFRPLLTERTGISSLHPIHTFLTRNLTHPSQ